MDMPPGSSLPIETALTTIYAAEGPGSDWNLQ
jgi:hypothetical protein